MNLSMSRRNGWIFNAFLSATLVLLMAPSYLQAKPKDDTQFWSAYKDEALGFEMKYHKGLYQETMCGGGNGDCKDTNRLMLRDKMYNPTFSLNVTVEREQLSETRDLEKFVNERYKGGGAKSVKKQTISGRPAFRIEAGNIALSVINLNDSEVLIIDWETKRNNWNSKDYYEKMVSTVKIKALPDIAKKEVAIDPESTTKIQAPVPAIAENSLKAPEGKWLKHKFDYKKSDVEIMYPDHLVLNTQCPANCKIVHNMALSGVKGNSIWSDFIFNAYIKEDMILPCETFEDYWNNFRSLNPKAALFKDEFKEGVFMGKDGFVRTMVTGKLIFKEVTIPLNGTDVFVFNYRTSPNPKKYNEILAKILSSMKIGNETKTDCKNIKTKSVVKPQS